MRSASRPLISRAPFSRLGKFYKKIQIKRCLAGLLAAFDMSRAFGCSGNYMFEEWADLGKCNMGSMTGDWRNTRLSSLCINTYAVKAC